MERPFPSAKIQYPVPDTAALLEKHSGFTESIPFGYSSRPSVFMQNNFIGLINGIHKSRFALSITLLFAAAIGIGMHYHVMWRDEFEAYLFRLHQGILNPGDPTYFFDNALTCLFLWINPSPWMFQFYHYLTIVAAIAVLNFLAPFSNLEKLFFSFNYFFIYEYGIISRYYAFLILILFLVVHLLTQTERNYFLIAILLLVLAEHNLMATLIAACLSLYLALDLCQRVVSGEIIPSWKSKLIPPAVFLVLGWAALITCFLITLPKLAFMSWTGGKPPLFTMVNQIWNSYVPIPDLHHMVGFWFSNIINYPFVYPPNYTFALQDLNFNYVLAFLLSSLILVIVCAKFRNNQILLFTYLLNTFLIVFFLQNTMKQYPIRYIGLLFLVFMYCYWIYCKFPACVISIPFGKKSQGWKILNPSPCTESPWISKCFQPMLWLILSGQLFAAGYAFTASVTYKFSLSEDAAKYIRWNNFQNTHVMVAYPDYIGQCVSAILNQKIYYPQSSDFGFMERQFDPKRKREIGFQEIKDACTNFTEKLNKKVLLILNFPLMASPSEPLVGPALLTDSTLIRLDQAFTEEVISGNEKYWLYEIYKKP